jgi:YVTN family beta-propeller protein
MNARFVHLLGGSILILVLTLLAGLSALAAPTHDLAATTGRDTLSARATAPALPSVWYFAEGYTGPGFDEYLTIFNPGSVPAPVTITYYLGAGSTRTSTLTVGANRRTTVAVHQSGAGVGRDQEVAARVERTDGGGLVVERPMYFTYGGVTGGHVTLGATQPGQAWYFAEGYTAPGFDQYLAMLNPNPTPASVTITYYLADGTTTPKHVMIGANSRTTVAVHEEAMGVGRGREVSARVTTTHPGGIVAERAMYFTYGPAGASGGGAIDGGHVALGAPSPRATWLFAEGYTGQGFDEYLTIMNPNDAEAPTTITYFLADGATVTKHLVVGAHHRRTVAVHEAREGVGRGREVAARVETTHPGGIIAERPMYFAYAGGITGGHTIVGATRTSDVWHFAEGYTAPGFDQYLTILNPGDSEVAVTIDYAMGDGTRQTRSLPVRAGSRRTVAVHDPAQGVGRGREVAAAVTAAAGGQIVVERPMYFTYAGGVTGGHVALGATVLSGGGGPTPPTPTSTPTVGSTPTSSPTAIPTATATAPASPSVSPTPAATAGRLPTLSAVIPGPAAAITVNPNTGRVYVAHAHGEHQGGAPGSVTVIEGSSQKIIDVITVGRAASAITVDPTRDRIYVTDAESDAVSIIDGQSHRILKSITVGDQPKAVAADPAKNRIYVANLRSNDVSVIDGSTGIVVARVLVGAAPLALAVNPLNGRVFVPNANDDSVTVIDGSTNSIIDTIDVGDYPRSVAINSITNRVYVANFGSFYGKDGTVSVLDGVSGAVVGTIPLSGSPGRLAVDSATNRLYVVEPFSDVMHVVDGLTNTIVKTVRDGSQPLDVAFDARLNRVYTPNHGTGPLPANISVRDSISLVSTAAILVGVGWGASPVAIDPGTGNVYVANLSDSSLTIVDGTSDRVIDAFDVGGGASHLVINPRTRRLYGITSTAIIEIDTATRTSRQIPVGRGLNSIAIDSDSDRIYVTDRSNDLLYTVDATQGVVLSAVSVGWMPAGVVIAPSARRVYVANLGDDTVTVIDTTTSAVIATIPVGRHPQNIALDPVSQRVYVVNSDIRPPSERGTVTVIDVAINAVIATIPVGYAPEFITVEAGTGLMYVSSGYDRNVSVVDLSTGSLIGTLDTFLRPLGMAFNPNTRRLYVVNNTVLIFQYKNS